MVPEAPYINSMPTGTTGHWSKWDGIGMIDELLSSPTLITGYIHA